MFQNPMQMIQQFNQFKNNFNGNAEQEVRRMLANGQMSQAQLNQLQKMASEFQRMFNIK